MVRTRNPALRRTLYHRESAPFRPFAVTEAIGRHADLIIKNSKSLRRLAGDHASLHTDGLPPNYLFPKDASSNLDDLTQLIVLLTGSQGTPYSQGLWRLHLKIPDDYPKSPPKASFRTRIWHPNVEESTGSVCVDTLKKDWESKLTLRDILIVSGTIQPPPRHPLMISHPRQYPASLYIRTRIRL